MEALTGVLRPPAHSERSEPDQPGVGSVLCQLLSSVSDDELSTGRGVCPVCHLWGAPHQGSRGVWCPSASLQQRTPPWATLTPALLRKGLHFTSPTVANLNLKPNCVGL